MYLQRPETPEFLYYKIYSKLDQLVSNTCLSLVSWIFWPRWLQNDLFTSQKTQIINLSHSSWMWMLTLSFVTGVLYRW